MEKNLEMDEKLPDRELPDKGLLEEELLRKVRCRKFALESYDLLQFIDEDNPLSEKESYRKLVSNLVDAKELSFQDGYFPIRKKWRFCTKLEMLWKRTLRKLIKIFYGWYVFPIYKRQSEYNDIMVENLNLMKEMMEQQQEELEFLREEVEKLREKKEEERQ